MQCIINFKATASMILKSTLHQNDISCKRVSPLKTSDIVCRELLMDAVHACRAMCFKSVWHETRVRFTKSPYCQTLYEASPTQLFTIWLILSPKPVSPPAALVARKCSAGPQGLDPPLALGSAPQQRKGQVTTHLGFLPCKMEL